MRKKMKTISVRQTSSLRGGLTPPGSKSLSIREIIFALLANGQSKLQNILDSDDTQAAQQVCAGLGAQFNLSSEGMTITSSGLPLVTSATELNTRNSGITTLFILPLLGLREHSAHPMILNCGEQMRARPIKSLVEALEHLGMHIQYKDQKDRLPVVVTGKLKGGIAEVEGINSQYLSALLIALPCAEQDSVITVKNLHERPYVNMTLQCLQQHGIDYTHQINKNVDTFHIRGKQRYKPVDHTIKGDFSSASCLMAASVLIHSEVELCGLDVEDAQGDKRLISILQEMGAEIVTEKEKIRIHGNQPLTGIRIDANDIPDLLPALAVIATQAQGKTEIYNVAQARIKETDRIHSMTQELRKMGAVIEEQEDGMTIYQSSLTGAVVNGHDDHRTVMALTVAGLVAKGITLISDGEAINKTYPQFVQDMQAIGANISILKAIGFSARRKRTSRGSVHPVHDRRRARLQQRRKLKCEEYNHHLILIGFKYVGKTSIGRALSKVLKKNFIDLDREVENQYRKKNGESFTCRQIMQTHGEAYYRELESAVLQEVLQYPPCVISLGGGTALSSCNQDLIKSQVLLHVAAPRGIVFERIMVDGRPAFFDPEKDPYESFNRLWEERNEVYRKLTKYTVNNSGTVEEAVVEAISFLK
jgi:3-phosphoshikimate 1-carboxyvinyltransferase